YSVVGMPYLGVPATKTFSGEPWEVMRENDLVYDIRLESVVRKVAITTLIAPPLSGFSFVAKNPIIQPGSRNASGMQVLSYDGEYLNSTQQLRVSEFRYE